MFNIMNLVHVCIKNHITSHLFGQHAKGKKKSPHVSIIETKGLPFMISHTLVFVLKESLLARLRMTFKAFSRFSSQLWRGIEKLIAATI
ncbi:MAG: hypothetical protein K0S39_1020 [Paenibacillus sp.]|nr:hypothetical protein [Paenibacillus sp.]